MGGVNHFLSINSIEEYTDRTAVQQLKLNNMTDEKKVETTPATPDKDTHSKETKEQGASEHKKA